ncbi:MAG: type III-A CRISPR-associated protein Cas10/Csm1, partial [Clostridia bacterium]|nr:type III-A CRISPR-associated protein Cas10/Csm1 [Clostridia bacterium]
MNMVRIYKKNGPDRKWYRAKQILVGDYTAKETLEELAQESEGVKRLAIYRADVDNLGNAFVAGFVNKVTGKNMASLSRTAVLSRQLSLFFKYHINHFLKGMEIAIVYAGGDDLFILGAWDDVLKAAMKIEKELCKYTQGTLTLSGGIGVYSSGSPVHVMAEESSELEEQSK